MSLKRIAAIFTGLTLPITVYLFIHWNVILSYKNSCRYHLYSKEETRLTFENEWKLFHSERKMNPKQILRNLNIVILMLVERGTELHEYKKAVNTVECYARIHNYTMKLAYDTGYDHRCPHKDKFFRRHCIAAIILEDFDYLLFLDADTGVVNPYRKIEEFIDERYDVLLYDRIWNQEIAAGSYLVKNSDFSKKFLDGFANYENQLDFNSEHGLDNGALHAYMAELLLGKNSETYRVCMDVYKSSKNLEDLFAFEVCIRAAIGRWQEFGRIKIFKKVTTKLLRKKIVKGASWIRDSWASNSIWSPRRDFFLHDWKEHNIQAYTNCELPIDMKFRYHGKLLFPLRGDIDLSRCLPGNMSWNYDINLVRSVEEINAELVRREFFIEQDRFRRLARIPYLLGF